MAEADALRMTAEVVDKFSTPLKNLQTMLRGIGDGTRVKNLQQDFDTVQKAASKAGAEIKNVLTPALAGMGIAGLSVSGALIGIGAALRSFAGNTAQLSLLSREVGLSAQRLREFGALGSHFGLDPGAMQGAARSFAENMRGIRTGAGETLGWLLSQGKNAQQRAIFQGFALDLKNTKSNEEALAKTLDFLRRIPDAVERSMLAQRLLGNGGLGILGSENWRKIVEEARKDLGTLAPEAEKNALAFERGLGRVQNQLRGLRDAIGSDVMPEINKMIDGLAKVFDENRPAIKKELTDSIQAVGQALRETDWKAVGGGLLFFLQESARFAGSAATAIEAVGKAVKAFRDGDILEGLRQIDQGTSIRKGTPEETRKADQDQLDAAKSSKADVDAWLKNAERPGMNPARTAPLIDEMRARQKQLEGEIRQLQEKLNRPADQAAPGQKLGALEQKQTVEEGTRKGTLAALREFLNSARPGSDTGSPKIETASFGGAARSWRGSGGRSAGGQADNFEDAGEASSSHSSRSRPRLPDPHDVGRAPGVGETQQALGAGGKSGRPANGRYYTAAEMAQIAMRNGATPEEAKILGGIAQAESSGNPNAHNGKGRDDSFGLWQINMKGRLEAERLKQFGLKRKEDLKDPDTNARAAIAIMRARRGFQDWSTYTSGAYRRGLAGASRGVQTFDPNSKTQPPGGDAANMKPGAGEYLRYDLQGRPVGVEKYDAPGYKAIVDQLKAANEVTGNKAGRAEWESPGIGQQDESSGPSGPQDEFMKGLQGLKNRKWILEDGGQGQKVNYQPGALLDRARDGGFMGGGVEANGSVNIRLEAPKGTKASSNTEGNLFKDVSLSRGASMPMSEDI